MRVLLIAFHFPPCATSSGLQRTLSFAAHLQEAGWRPHVLTCSPSAYERVSKSQLSDIPADVSVVRTPSLDVARHLAIGGRYWSRLAIPDRWASWTTTAVPAALAAIRREKVDVIWSTYPIATAHRIAALVAKASGVPWVADFRDPMVEAHPQTGELFPTDRRLRNARLRIEEVAVERASRLVFCTEGARALVAERYPRIEAGRLTVISNGFDEATFAAVERSIPPRGELQRRVLVHSGTVYPGADRDPSALFAALRRLLDKGAIDAREFELRLRNPSNELYFQGLADKFGVASIVSILPALDYRDALAEMLTADGLLLLQGITSNPAVPAKCYEYLRARRPIIALIHPDGETARTLSLVGVKSVAPLDDASAIESLLEKWIESSTETGFGIASPDMISSYSRSALAHQLATVLGAAANDRPRGRRRARQQRPDR